MWVCGFCGFRKKTENPFYTNALRSVENFVESVDNFL